MLCGIPNRGRKVMLSFFNRAPYSLDPSTGAEFGDGFLMQQGYTLVWLGWQWDPTAKARVMRLYAPGGAWYPGAGARRFRGDAKGHPAPALRPQPHPLPG